MDNTAGQERDLPLIDVSCGIIWREQTFLAARRTESRDLGGLWEFPGGKCEANEIPEQALARELAEELGISVLESSLWEVLEYSYPQYGYRVRLHFFHVSAFEGEPVARERQALKWVTPFDALSLPFVPADQPILTRLSSLRLLAD